MPKDSVILYNFQFTKDLMLHPDIQKHLRRRYKELKRENQQKKKEERLNKMKKGRKTEKELCHRKNKELHIQSRKKRKRPSCF